MTECGGGSLQAALCQLHLHRQRCVALLLPLLFTLLVVLVLAAADALAYMVHCHWLLGLQDIENSGCVQRTPCNASAAPKDGIDLIIIVVFTEKHASAM